MRPCQRWQTHTAPAARAHACAQDNEDLRAEAARAEAAAGAAGAALADAERRRAALRSAATQTADARRAAAAVQTLPAAAIACDATQMVRSDCTC